MHSSTALISPMLPAGSGLTRYAVLLVVVMLPGPLMRAESHSTRRTQHVLMLAMNLLVPNSGSPTLEFQLRYIVAFFASMWS